MFDTCYTMETQKKERIVWIDVAKGFSIWLVALGHLGLSNVSYAGEWLSSFRMPFFFFVSGILFSTKYDLKTFIQRRDKTLIRPYFYFSFVVIVCLYFLGAMNLHQMYNVLKIGWGGIALWFIPVLFLTQLLWFVIRKHSSTKMSLLMIVLSSFIGFISSFYVGASPYNILLVFTAVSFLGLGSLLKERLISFFQKATMYDLFKYLVISFVLSWAYVGNMDMKISYMSNQLGYGLPTLVSGVCGSLFVCILVNILLRVSRNRKGCLDVFVFSGKNSYVILAFHQLVMIWCVVYVRPLIHSYFLYKTFELVFIALVCYCLIRVINQYLPWMLGRQKSYN